MENDCILEKELADSIDSKPLEELKYLIPEAEKGICKIKYNDASHGTGFLLYLWWFEYFKSTYDK